MVRVHISMVIHYSTPMKSQFYLGYIMLKSPINAIKMTIKCHSSSFSLVKSSFLLVKSQFFLVNFPFLLVKSPFLLVHCHTHQHYQVWSSAQLQCCRPWVKALIPMWIWSAWVWPTRLPCWRHRRMAMANLRGKHGGVTEFFFWQGPKKDRKI